ncbi:hypothetical protein [Desulforhopalus sp. 52FAK]
MPIRNEKRCDFVEDKGSKGIVYVAFGYEYLLMAAYSAYSAKLSNPGIQCSLVTNIKIRNVQLLKIYFDFVEIINEKNNSNRLTKTQAIKYAPFEKCLYLDCDTEVRGDLSVMFNCLDRFDVILKMNARPYLKDYMVAEGIPGYLFPIWNGGLIFFRNGVKARLLFDNWYKNFTKFGKKSDMPALACSIYQQPDLRVLSTNAIWNTFPNDIELLTVNGVNFDSKIWHYRKVNEFPSMVPKVLEHHQTISCCIDSKDERLSKEISEVEERYKIMCTIWFQSKLFRPLFIKFFDLIRIVIGKPHLTLYRKTERSEGAFADIDESKMHW